MRIPRFPLQRLLPPPRYQGISWGNNDISPSISSIIIIIFFFIIFIIIFIIICTYSLKHRPLNLNEEAATMMHHFLHLLLALSSSATISTAQPDTLAAPKPTSLDDDSSIFTRAALNSSSPAPNATVELCTEPQFQGQCLNSTWPINTCISLNGYAGSVLSFQPIPGYECLLTQKRCNVAMPYISIGSDDETNTAGDDLSNLSWIANSDSYMCFTEMEALRRFVRMRLRVPLREARKTETKREKEMMEKRWTWVDEVAENLERENARAALREA